jgi:hypothetical protein
MPKAKATPKANQNYVALKPNITVPTPPVEVPPSLLPEIQELYENVHQAILALPAFFVSETYIEGLRVTDIFSLNTLLGATIEDQCVTILNRHRKLWDPEGKFSLYRFVRQSQVFPDVLLIKAGEAEPIMGLELKGWFLGSLEKEPSYRFKATQAACNPQDLLVVVPWALSNMIAGKPRIFTPIIRGAQYAAQRRNYYWMYEKTTAGSRTIGVPQGVTPYPKLKSIKIADKPEFDEDNFGRVARSGIAAEDCEAAMDYEFAGVKVRLWHEFFKQGKASQQESEQEGTLAKQEATSLPSKPAPQST